MKKRPVRGALTENLIAFIPIMTNKFCKPFSPQFPSLARYNGSFGPSVAAPTLI